MGFRGVLRMIKTELWPLERECFRLPRGGGQAGWHCADEGHGLIDGAQEHIVATPFQAWGPTKAW